MELKNKFEQLTEEIVGKRVTKKQPIVEAFGDTVADAVNSIARITGISPEDVLESKTYKPDKGYYLPPRMLAQLFLSDPSKQLKKLQSFIEQNRNKVISGVKSNPADSPRTQQRNDNAARTATPPPLPPTTPGTPAPAPTAPGTPAPAPAPVAPGTPAPTPGAPTPAPAAPGAPAPVPATPAPALRVGQDVVVTTKSDPPKNILGRVASVNSNGSISVKTQYGTAAFNADQIKINNTSPSDTEVFQPGQSVYYRDTKGVVQRGNVASERGDSVLIKPSNSIGKFDAVEVPRSQILLPPKKVKWDIARGVTTPKKESFEYVISIFPDKEIVSEATPAPSGSTGPFKDEDLANYIEPGADPLGIFDANGFIYEQEWGRFLNRLVHMFTRLSIRSSAYAGITTYELVNRDVFSHASRKGSRAGIHFKEEDDEEPEIRDYLEKIHVNVMVPGFLNNGVLVYLTSKQFQDASKKGRFSKIIGGAANELMSAAGSVPRPRI